MGRKKKKPAMHIKIHFMVYGEQRPAGSKRAVPIKRADGSFGLRVIHDNPHTKPWMAEVKAVAAEHFTGPLMGGPVSLQLAFVRPRPKSHFGKRGVKPSAPALPITKPDSIKLARAIEDALTGVVWRDDAQVCLHVISKSYGERFLTEIEIKSLEE